MRKRSMGSSAKPFAKGGRRFRALEGELSAKGAANPGALAAWIGRRKYGKRRFQEGAAAARGPK